MASRDRAIAVPGFGPVPPGHLQAGRFQSCGLPGSAPPGSGSPAGSLGTVPPSRVAGHVLQEVCAGGLELLAVHAQPEEPAPEGVGRVVGDRAGRARGSHRQGLVGNREAKLDVGFQLTGVKSVLLTVAGVGKLEKSEFNRTLGEGGVEVQSVMLSST